MPLLRVRPEKSAGADAPTESRVATNPANDQNRPPHHGQADDTAGMSVAQCGQGMIRRISSAPFGDD